MAKINGSLALSIILHVIFFALLAITMVQTVTPTVMVSLHPDPNPKIIKSTLVDHRALELAQKQKQEQAQKALELAALKKQQQEQARVEQEQKLLAEQKLAEAKIQKQLEQKQLEQKQIAQKKLEQKQLEQKQAEQKQLAQKKLDQKQLEQKQLAQKKLAAQQADAIKAQQTRLQAEHNAFLATEIDKYRALFKSLIEENRVMSAVFTPDLRCKIRIRLLPDGSILSVAITESSGNSAYDEMSSASVYKSAPFPMPQDQELYSQLRDVILSFTNGEQAANA